jgi:hypothetical protein
MTRQLFDEYIGQPPPSTIDVKAIVRTKRRRTIGAITASAFMAAALAATATAIALDGGASHPIADPSPPGSPAPTEAGFRLVADDRESARATAERLRKALDDAVHATAPSARWTEGRPPELISWVGHTKSGEMFFGGGLLSVDGRAGGVSLQVIVNHCNAPKPPPKRKCTPEESRREEQRLQNDLRCGSRKVEGITCVESRTPSGARMRTTTAIQRMGSLRMTSIYNLVFVELADGRVLYLGTSTRCDTTCDATGSPSQQQPVLSVSQLTDIATTVARQILP